MEKIAQLFPGQGSQSPGMVSDLHQTFDCVKDVFNTAADVLGFDLLALIRNEPEALNQTENTQVAMLSAGYAAHLVLKQISDVKSDCFAGHSLGEYTALSAAGYLSFEQALALVRKRAELMRDAVPKGSGGAAAVLGLDDDSVKEVCAQTSGVVEAVNFNSPGQVVISGAHSAVESACRLAKEKGAKRAVLLPISVPVHSSLLTDAAAEFRVSVEAADWLEGDGVVIHNVDVSIASSINEIKEKLVLQLYQPVCWHQTIDTIYHKRGISTMIECGPGKVLTGLNRRINADITTYALFDSTTAQEIKNVNG